MRWKAGGKLRRLRGARVRSFLIVTRDEDCNHTAYVMHGNDRARVTCAVAEPAVRKSSVVTPPAPGLIRFDLSMTR
jgi:hypothetical protein